MTLRADLQRPVPGTYVQLFVLDLTGHGGDVLRFTPMTSVEGSPPDQTEVRFDGEVFTPVPIEITGLTVDSRRAPSRPLLRFSNVGGLITQLLRDHGGLRRAPVTRIRTLGQYLDNGATPDPEEYLRPVDRFVISRKSLHNKSVVEFELRASVDAEGIVIPKRQLLPLCPFPYRYWDPVAEALVYSTKKLACPFTAEGPGSYFDEFDQPVANASQDKCSHELTGCEARFGAGNPLPFGGMPSAQRIR